MHAHVLFLSLCVALLARGSAGARLAAEKPVSNLHLLQNFGHYPTADNIKVVKWLVRALQRYLNDNGADESEMSAEVGPNYRAPEHVSVVVEQVDKEVDSGERRDDEGDDDTWPPVLPMLPLVERDQPRPDSHEHVRENIRDILKSYWQDKSNHLEELQPRSQNIDWLFSKFRALDPDSQHLLQEYVKALLEAEWREDDDEPQFALPSVEGRGHHTHEEYHDSELELQHRGAPDLSQVRLQDLQPIHSMNDHVRLLPPELQGRVVEQGHVQDDQRCVWCALFRDMSDPSSSSRIKKTASPSSSKQKAATGKDTLSVSPLTLFKPLSGRKWFVHHEDYPGMMNQMMNVALDNREKRKFRIHKSQQ